MRIRKMNVDWDLEKNQILGFSVEEKGLHF